MAYADDKPVGFLAFKRSDALVEVLAIVVMPAFQGKGIGKQLMTTLLSVTEGKEIVYATQTGRGGNQGNVHRVAVKGMADAIPRVAGIH